MSVAYSIKSSLACRLKSTCEFDGWGRAWGVELSRPSQRRRSSSALADAADAAGQGCPFAQVLLASLAATACSLTRVPSSQRKVSPSFT